MRLILVRHAMPVVDAAVRPEHWELGDAGRSAATHLARRLPAGAVLVSSMEPKAHHTLTPAGRVVKEPGLNEVERDEPFEGDFRARRRSYVEGVDHPGWEPREQVVSRFDAVLSRYPQGSVFASHGMAMTLWLTARVGLPDPGAFWDALRLPDAFEVDTESRTVRRVRPPLAESLDLLAHPEGGWYRETWRAPVEFTPPGYPGSRSTATGIYFLLCPGEESRWHRVRSDEVWMWHRGGSLTLRLSQGEQPGEVTEVCLGPDVEAGQQPQVVIPGGTWQAARPAADNEVLVSCVVSPGFDFHDFILLP